MLMRERVIAIDAIAAFIITPLMLFHYFIFIHDIILLLISFHSLS